MAEKIKIAELEPALKKIGELIEKMEKGELTLEQSLNYFEQGITLIKNSQQILQEAEQKVQVLIQQSSVDQDDGDGSGEDLKPYHPESDNERASCE